MVDIHRHGMEHTPLITPSWVFNYSANTKGRIWSVAAMLAACNLHAYGNQVGDWVNWREWNSDSDL